MDSSLQPSFIHYGSDMLRMFAAADSLHICAFAVQRRKVYGHHISPLHATYQPDSCLPSLLSAMAEALHALPLRRNFQCIRGAL